MLTNTRLVLDCTIALTRNIRSINRGITTNIITNDTIHAAEEIFAEIDINSIGLIHFYEIDPVLKIFGIDLNEESKEELLRILDITEETEISFPEIVDIVSFYEK